MYITTEKEYGPGSLLTFDAEAPGKATALTVDITPVQDLHGQSNPYPPGGGVNKLPPMVDGTYEGNGVKAVVSNGVATLSGTTTASGNALIIPLQSSYTFVGGEYLHLGNSAVGSWQPSFENASNPAGGVTAAVSPANRIVQVASGKAGYEVTRIRFYLGNGVTLSGTLAPMICTDNTARAYAPYSNVCPISGWSEARVTRTGKNCVDKAEIIRQFIYSDGYLNSYRYTFPFYLAPNTTYRLSCSGAGNSTANTSYVFCRIYSGTDISKGAAGTTKNLITNKEVQQGFTFTTGVTGVVRFAAYWSGYSSNNEAVSDISNAIGDLQIEVGSSATAYESYAGDIYTIDLDGTRYGGTLDVLTGVLTVDRFYVQLTEATHNWGVATTGGVQSVGYYLYVHYSGEHLSWPTFTNPAALLCDTLPRRTVIPGYGNPYGICLNTNYVAYRLTLDQLGIESTATSAERKAAAEAWLANNPTHICYVMAEPQIVQLTPQQVTTLVGINNVWANTGNTFLRVAEFLEVGESSVEQFKSYLEALRGDFTKLAKLEFLNPGGDVAFTLDNNPLNKRSGAFLQSGSISCNLQNGRRRQASVTLHNLDHAYEYAVEHIWFGQQIRLSEGLILPDGTEFYIPQGVFEIESPAEALKPGQRTVTYNLVDKWCNLDGTHFGNLEDVYSVTAGTNILAAVAALLKLDRFTAENNGANPIDPVAPLFTNYYNDKTQTLTDGTVVSLIEAPYDFLSASTGNYADVVLGLAEMIAGDVGYNQTGRFVINPSQDDIADQNKPILWEFTENDKTFLGADYSPKPADRKSVV